MTEDFVGGKLKQKSISGKARLQAFFFYVPGKKQEEEGAETKKEEYILKPSDEIRPQKSICLRAKSFLGKAIGRKASAQH